MEETQRQGRTGPDVRRVVTETGLAALGVNRWLGRDGQCGEMGTLVCLPSHEKKGDGHGSHGVQQYEGRADRAPTSLRPESDCGATNAERHRKSSSASSPRRPGGGGGGGGEQWLCVAGGGPESRGVDKHPGAVGIRAFCPTPVGVVPLRTVGE